MTTTVTLLTIYTIGLIATAVEVYRERRQKRKQREAELKFRAYIRRTYGKDGDKKSWCA